MRHNTYQSKQVKKMKEIKITIPDGAAEIVNIISDYCTEISGRKVDNSKICRYALYHFLDEYAQKKKGAFESNFWKDPYIWIKHLDVMKSMKAFDMDTTTPKDRSDYVNEVDNM